MLVTEDACYSGWGCDRPLLTPRFGLICIMYTEINDYKDGRESGTKALYRETFYTWKRNVPP